MAFSEWNELKKGEEIELKINMGGFAEINKKSSNSWLKSRVLDAHINKIFSAEKKHNPADKHVDIACHVSGIIFCIK